MIFADSNFYNAFVVNVVNIAIDLQVENLKKMYEGAPSNETEFACCHSGCFPLSRKV